MPRRDRRQGVPDLDPFGANDPAWERYEGISWLRRVARSGALHQRRRPGPKGELWSALLVGMLGWAILVGGVVLVFWLASLVID